MNPSNIAQHELRTRAYITYYLNSRKLDHISDSKLKNWKRKVESRLTAYINGETTAKDIIHPSKFSGLSQEALKHKLQKTKMLQSHRKAIYHRHASTTDWINLGKLLNSKKSDVTIKKLETEVESTIPCYFETHLQNQSIITREDPKNTVFLNGNVNILCLNVKSPKPVDSETRAQKICEDIDQELKMLISCESAKRDQISDLQIFHDLRTEPAVVCETANTWIQKAPEVNVNELTRMVNELLPAIQKLRRQHLQLLSDCRELVIERKILLKHQEITDKTINILDKETNELKEKNRLLVQRSENTISKLIERNQHLTEELQKKEMQENELSKQNCFLLEKLRQEDEEKQRLIASINNFQRKLNEKIRKIEQYFDAVVDCIVKTEKEVQELRNNSANSVDKKMLLNTIRKLDEQNSNLMGKVKHIPEKIKNILIHVSCTMNTLEEQNIRLLRTLQNSEIENLFENKLLKKVKE